MDENRPKRFSLYRANKKGDGTACQFNVRPDIESVFLQMASQTNKMTDSGHATFDWEESKAIFKMGISDISEVLCVLEGRKQKVGAQDGKYAGSLFHQNSDGNSSLAFEKSDKGGFYMSLSIKKGSDLKRYGQYLSEAEGKCLSVLLRKSIEAIYYW